MIDTDKDKPHEKVVQLRRQAEVIAREKAAMSPENLDALSPEEISQTLHELRVHQIELEVQNEELRTAQADLEAAQMRYFNFYDLAPVGYFTLSGQGLILETNLTSATLLGMARNALIKQPFTRYIIKEDQDIFYLHRKQLFETGEPQTCELRIMKNDGTALWTLLTATTAQDTDGVPVCRVMMSDITERKRTEEALKQHVDELKARNEELMRFNNVATDRELRMVELKREVNELCCRAGLQRRYPLEFDTIVSADGPGAGEKPSAPK